MGENFEIEIIARKMVPVMAISKFLVAIGIECTLQDYAETIENWRYEGLQRVDLDEKIANKEVAAGKIVLINGCTFDKKALGAILHYNADYNAYSTSIWFDSSLINRTAVLADAVVNTFDIFIPFDVELIAMGIEMNFIYRGDLQNTLKSSAGILEWFGRQDNRFVRGNKLVSRKDKGTVLLS